MMRKRNIYLIGAMGAGKTTVGRYLACLCHCPFYDSDLIIENQYQKTITQLCSNGQDTHFRFIERNVIKCITQYTGIILATGGGSVLDVYNRTLLKHNGTIVHLSVSIERQLNRLMSSPIHNRPLLKQAKNKKALLIKLKTIRDPIYKKLAHINYNTDECSPLILAKKIYTDHSY